VSIQIIKVTRLDYAIAEEFFGWRWLATFGRPVRSHPEYPKEMSVRRFFPPAAKLGKNWERYFANEPHTEATGDEPLDYCYESSSGPHMIPTYSTTEDDALLVVREIKKRRLFAKWLNELQAIVGSDKTERWYFATPEHKCIAALAAIDSKYIQRAVEAEGATP
jgi:hypothetical protein